MKLKQYVVLALGVAIAAVFLYTLIPSGLGIKGQLRWLFQGAIWVITWITVIAVWLLEAIVLFIGPWFLGWFGRWGIQLADEKLTPDQDMTRFQGFLLNFGLVVVVFLLWILVAFTATWVPPISTFIVGPWIQNHVETGLVWWGVYAALAYMLFAPARDIFNDI